MSDPIELLEAQRRIKAAQSAPIGPTRTATDLSASLAKLQATLEAHPTVPDRSVTVQERSQTVEKLRSVWNAPERHKTRSQFNLDATEWIVARDKLAGLLGTGFTAALVGTRGPGKTQLGVELMKVSTERLRSAYYCTAMDYFMRIKGCFGSDRSETQADAQKFFARFKLLIVDELNVRSDSAWEDNMLADLIGKRYNALLDTVLISNESGREFEKSMGPSIIDRLNETGGVLEATWPSFRK